MNKKKTTTRRTKMNRSVVDHQADVPDSDRETDLADQYLQIKRDFFRLRKDILVGFDMVRDWFKT